MCSSSWQKGNASNEQQCERCELLFLSERDVSNEHKCEKCARLLLAEEGCLLFKTTVWAKCEYDKAAVSSMSASTVRSYRLFSN